LPIRVNSTGTTPLAAVFPVLQPQPHDQPVPAGVERSREISLVWKLTGIAVVSGAMAAQSPSALEGCAFGNRCGCFQFASRAKSGALRISFCTSFHPELVGHVMTTPGIVSNV
jgi:hypothetical protein